jgi:hypothetical protein
VQLWEGEHVIDGSLELNSCYCADPATAQATRRDLLGWQRTNGALVLPAHLSGHSALEVARDGGTFRLELGAVPGLLNHRLHIACAASGGCGRWRV